MMEHPPGRQLSEMHPTISKRCHAAMLFVKFGGPAWSGQGTMSNDVDGELMGCTLVAPLAVLSFPAGSGRRTREHPCGFGVLTVRGRRSPSGSLPVLWQAPELLPPDCA